MNLKTRNRRVTLSPALKTFMFAAFGLMVLALTGALLLIFDLMLMICCRLKRPFPRGKFRLAPLIKRPI